jgi:hypothetical protein
VGSCSANLHLSRFSAPLYYCMHLNVVHSAAGLLLAGLCSQQCADQITGWEGAGQQTLQEAQQRAVRRQDTSVWQGARTGACIQCFNTETDTACFDAQDITLAHVHLHTPTCATTTAHSCIISPHSACTPSPLAVAYMYVHMVLGGGQGWETAKPVDQLRPKMSCL